MEISRGEVAFLGDFVQIDVFAEMAAQIPVRIQQHLLMATGVAVDGAGNGVVLPQKHSQNIVDTGAHFHSGVRRVPVYDASCNALADLDQRIHLRVDR